MKTAKRSRGRRGLGRYQVLLLPALALLMGAAVFLVWSFVKSETQEPLQESVYQYFLDQKVSYGEDVLLLAGEGRIIFEEDGQRGESDPSPIYCEGKETLILPVDMSWLDPANGLEWRLPAFGRLELDEDRTVWYLGIDNESRIKLDGGVLSNGRGTYVFLENGTLRFNGLASAVGPFSFYSTENGMYRVYQYGEDTLSVKGRREENTLITMENGYHFDLTTGIFAAVNGEQKLLAASPAVLKDITER